MGRLVIYHMLTLSVFLFPLHSKHFTQLNICPKSLGFTFVSDIWQVSGIFWIHSIHSSCPCAISGIGMPRAQEDPVLTRAVDENSRENEDDPGKEDTRPSFYQCL